MKRISGRTVDTTVPLKRKRFGSAPYTRVYLVAPRTPPSFWSMQDTVDAVGGKALMPSATLGTLVSLTPAELGIEYHYCDENISAIDWQIDCDLVAITGMTLHEPRIRIISERFRARGIPVALGGPYATLDRERAASLADHLFVGEGEYTWPRFLHDLTSKKPAALYEQQTLIDMAHSPPPDWSFIRGDDYLNITVQTSRGCPNRCDFCDAVQLVGHKPRRKQIDRVIEEIDNARRAGAETVFFSEDNFYIGKRYTRELLRRIVEWNTAQDHPVQFSCQASVRIADHDEILQLLADARFAVVFLGLESLRKECLEEVNKGHLHREDIARRLGRMTRHGLLPFIGLIVGFDADDAATFDEIDRFLNETGSPIASLSVLNAPEGTPLHERMVDQQRIDESFQGVWHFSTNIVPKQWPLRELLQRRHDLFRKLYEPEHFEARAMAWLNQVEYFPSLYTRRRRAWKNITKIARIVRYYMLHAPPQVRRQFVRILWRTYKLDPRLVRKAITVMTQYCHYYTFSQDDEFLRQFPEHK